MQLALDPDFCPSSAPKFLAGWPGPQLPLPVPQFPHAQQCNGQALGLDFMAGGPSLVPKGSSLAVSPWRGQVAEDRPRRFCFGGSV